MPSISYTDAAAAQLHTFARRDTNEGVIIPVVVVVGILVIIAVITWVRVVKARERKLWPKRTHMAAANPIGRVRHYQPETPQPRRPRTPPALRPRTENTYVRRPDPAQPRKKMAGQRQDSAQPTPPLYRSEVPTPEQGPSTVNAPVLEIPTLPDDLTPLPVLDSPAPAPARPISTQEPPPPYVQRDGK